MRLINARPSPYGRKVAVALKETKIPFDVEYDVPWAGTTRTPEFNPLEQLPILILDTDEVVYDSTYILEWLELRYPESPLLPVDVDAKLAAKLLQMLGERLMEFTATIVFELQRAEPARAWMNRHESKLRRGLAELDRLLARRRPGVSEPITLGDIAVGTTLQSIHFMMAHGLMADLEVLKWEERHPNLVEFVNALEERPSFRETRPEMMDVDLQAVVA